MPFDPSIALKAIVPKFSDPMEDYKQYMSLRDLVDQRRVRDLQVRRLELQEQEAQREEAERQAFKAAVARGAKPEELIATNPGLGIRYNTNLATMQGQQRLAQDAEINRRRKINQDIASLGMSAVQIADPLERAKYHAAGIASLVDQGALKPEEFGKYRIPADQREAEMQYGSAFGPDKLRELRDKATQEARAAAEERRKVEEYYHKQFVTNPLETRQKLGQAITAEQQATGTQPITPYQQQTLEQARETHEDVVNQQTRMYGLASGNAAETKRYHDLVLNAAQGKTSAAVQGKVLALKNIDDSITAYQTELKNTGTKLPFQSGEGSARLKSRFTDLQMQIKNLYELGAITGPDMELLQGAITDPTSWKGNWMESGSLLEQLKVMKSVIQRSKTNLASTYQQQQNTNRQDAAAGALGEMSNDQLFQMLTGGAGAR